MAVALDKLVDLAVGTSPQSNINVHNLNDLLHAMVRSLAASHAQGGSQLPSLHISTAQMGGKTAAAAADAAGRASSAIADGDDGAQSRPDSVAIHTDVTRTDVTRTDVTRTDVTRTVVDGDTGVAGNDHQNESGNVGAGRESSMTSASGVTSSSLFALSEGQVRAMENKLNTLENRLNTLNSLDEVQRRASEGGTPLADMWNFSTITRRLDAAEEGVAKVCGLMDDLAKELGAMRQKNMESEKRSEEIEKKLVGLTDDLEMMSDKADSGARNKLQGLADELTELKTDVNENFAKCEDLEDLVTWQALEDCLKSRIPEPPPPQQQVALPVTRQERVKSAKKALPSNEAMKALQQVGALSDKHVMLATNVSDLENALAGKLTAEDIANLAPKEHIELVADLQARVLALEDQVGKNMKDDFERLKELVNVLQEASQEASALDAEKMQSILNSHTSNEQLIKDMAHQMGLLRDQLSILEKTLDALQNASLQQSGPAPTIDPELIEGFQSQVGGLKDEQQLLHDALKELLRDVSENKQHVQVLYQGVENLDQVKADKEFVALEVEDKADRQSLDDKASRAWVDNHIHQLTQEILMAKDKVVGQDEKLQGALDRLATDVDSKLDRLELEPLKQYLESKIPKNAPQMQEGGKGESGDWDAAGMKRALLKFHCISCDRPVLMKADGPVNPLPVAGSMRPQKVALRPANILELEAMREQQRRFVSGMDGYPVTSMPATNRSCGGGHTLTHPTRRARLIPPVTTLFGSDSVVPQPPPPPPAGRGVHESDVVGQNGQIYRGRFLQNGAFLPQIPPSSKGMRRSSKSAKDARPNLSPARPGAEDRATSSMDVTARSMQTP